MIEGIYLEEWGTFSPSPRQQWLIDQSNLHHKGLWSSFCRRLVTVPLAHPLDVSVLGVRVRLYPAGNLCEKRVLFAQHTFDPAELKVLADRAHEQFKFVDVGANVGLYSLFVAAKCGPLARILTIEPQPEIKERLKYNLSVNQPHGIRHVACAVSDKAGMMRMGISLQNRGGSGFTLRSGKAPDEDTIVQARTLAEVLTSENMQGADALKMDIEGAEEIVLPKFFEDTNDQDLPKLLILEENPDWKVDCIALAEARGYVRTLTTRRNVVLVRG